MFYVCSSRTGEFFATVRVGILKLSFPVLLLAFRVRGIHHFEVWYVFFLGDLFLRAVFFFLLWLLLWMFCFLSQEIFNGDFALPLLFRFKKKEEEEKKACLKMYFWLTLRATSRGLLLVFKNRRGHRLCDPPLKHMLLVLSPLHYDRARTLRAWGHR